MDLPVALLPATAVDKESVSDTSGSGDLAMCGTSRQRSNVPGAAPCLLFTWTQAMSHRFAAAAAVSPVGVYRRIDEIAEPRLRAAQTQQPVGTSVSYN